MGGFFMEKNVKSPESVAREYRVRSLAIGAQTLQIENPDEYKKLDCTGSSYAIIERALSSDPDAESLAYVRGVLASLAKPFGFEVTRKPVANNADQENRE